MSNEGGFIHISEAVKVYNRTRQSFYNYINKDQIETKKVNNKLYLNIKDIEQLLSPYLGTAQEHQLDADELSVELQKIEDTTEATKHAIETLKLDITEKLIQFSDNLRMETNNTLYKFREQIEQSNAQLLKEKLLTIRTESSDPTMLLRLKKHQFYLGYIEFIAINIIILGILY